MSLADTAKLIATYTLEDHFSRPAADAEHALDRLNTKTSTLGRISSEAGRGIGNAANNLRTLGTIGAGFAVAGLTFAIHSASDLAESLAKSDVVFGENAAAVEAWASRSATAFGQSKQQALEAAATYGNLFSAMGFGVDQSTAMSESLVELAADLASFNNTSVDDALLALRSGLTGETEPLKRFGVNLNEARLKEEALRLGLTTSATAVLPAAIKAQAAYSLILQDTALAQGDFARTSDGLANQQRILKANLTDTAAIIGTALLPKIIELVGKVNTLVTDHKSDIEDFADNLGEAFDAIVEIAGNLPWSAIGSAFEFMGKGSKALLEAFNGLPPWVQTAVLTGWGLNKLTGGALGNIVSALATGLIKGVLGINAGVVNINAATVAGGGGVAGGAPATGGGALGTAARAIGAAVVIGAAAEVGSQLHEGIVQPAQRAEERRAASGAASLDVARLSHNLGAIDHGLGELQHETIAVGANIVASALTGNTNIVESLSEQRRTTIRSLQVAQVAQARQAEAEAGRRADAARALQSQAASLVKLQQIASKPTTFTTSVSTTVNVDGRKVASIIQKHQQAVGHGAQESF